MGRLKFALIFIAAICHAVHCQQRRIGSNNNNVIISTSGQSNTRQNTGSDFECPEEFGYYPHKTDCTKYYVCVFGGALLESCTGGLQYSHELQTCDWPRNVGCESANAEVIDTTTQRHTSQPQNNNIQQLSRVRFGTQQNYNNNQPSQIIINNNQQSQQYITEQHESRPNPNPLLVNNGGDYVSNGGVNLRLSPKPVVTSRGEPRRLLQDTLSKLYSDAESDDLSSNRNRHNNHNDNSGDDDDDELDDVVQRVYRGQPSTVGQVQRDRDGLTLHTNALPTQGKVGSFSFGTQVQQPIQQYRVEQNQYNTAQDNSKRVQNDQRTNSYNTNRNNNTSSRNYATPFDPYYSLSVYDEDVELYKDQDYSPRPAVVQQTYRTPIPNQNLNIQTHHSSTTLKTINYDTNSNGNYNININNQKPSYDNRQVYKNDYNDEIDDQSYRQPIKTQTRSASETPPNENNSEIIPRNPQNIALNYPPSLKNTPQNFNRQFDHNLEVNGFKTKVVSNNFSESSKNFGMNQNRTEVVKISSQNREQLNLEDSSENIQKFDQINSQIVGQKSASSTQQSEHDLNTNNKLYPIPHIQREKYIQTSDFDTTQEQTNNEREQIANNNYINHQNDNTRQDSIQIPKVLNRFSTLNLPESSTYRTFTSRNNNKDVDVNRKPLNYYIYNSDVNVPQTTENANLRRDEISTEIYNDKTKLRIEPIYHRNLHFLNTSAPQNSNNLSLIGERQKVDKVRNVVVEPNSGRGAQDNIFARPEQFRDVILSTTEPIKANLDNDALLSHVTRNPWTNFRDLVSSTITPNRFRSNKLQDIYISTTPQPTHQTTTLIESVKKENRHDSATSTKSPSTEKNIESSTASTKIGFNSNSNQEKSLRLRQNFPDKEISTNRPSTSTQSSTNHSRPRPSVRQPSPFMIKKNSEEIPKDSQESESITQLRKKPFLFDEKPFSSFSDINKQNQNNFVTDSILLVNSRRAFKEGLNKTREVQRTTVSPYKSLETIRTTFDDNFSDLESITKRLNLEQPKLPLDDPIDIPTTFRPNLKFILTSEPNNFEDHDLFFESKTQEPLHQSVSVSSNQQVITNDGTRISQNRGRYSFPVIDDSTTTEEVWKEPPFKSRFSFPPRNSKNSNDAFTEQPNSSTKNSVTNLSNNKFNYDISERILNNKNDNRDSSISHFNTNNRGYIKHKYFLENYESSTERPIVSTHPPYKQKFRATVEVPNINSEPPDSTTDVSTRMTTEFQLEINEKAKAAITTFRPHVNDQKPINITNATKVDNIRVKINKPHTTKRPMTDEERFRMEFEQIRSDLTHASRQHANLGRVKSGNGYSKPEYRRHESTIRRDQSKDPNEGSIVKLRTDFVRSKINSQRDKDIFGRLRANSSKSSNEDKANAQSSENPSDNLSNSKLANNEERGHQSLRSGFVTGNNNFNDDKTLSTKIILPTDKTVTESSQNFDEIKAYIDQLNFDETSTEVIDPYQNPRKIDHTKIYLRPKINLNAENYTNQEQSNIETVKPKKISKYNRIYSQDGTIQSKTHLEQLHEPTPTAHLDHTKLYMYQNHTSLEERQKDVIDTYLQQNVTDFDQVLVDDQKVFDGDSDLGILKTLNQKPVLVPAIPSRASRVNPDIRQMINNRNRDQNHNRDPVKCSKDNTSSRCNEVIAVSTATTRSRGRGNAHYTTGDLIETSITPSNNNVNRGTPANRGSRPTLKPSTSIIARAQEFVDIYRYPPSRPSAIYPVPTPDKPAAKCRADVCLIPDCNCGGKDIPGNISVKETPQIVLLTFDDAINDLNSAIYEDLFEKGRKNPNGCPITATFYVSHEWTDYSQVQNLYADGHEMASHTISHSFGEQFSQRKWAREVAGQREILAAYGGVRLEDVRGMRAPFLSVGGNKMYKMLYDQNFTYDSSMPVYENRPPSWPYTLDYKLFHDCMIPPCPTRSYPGVWEVPMVMWQDLNGGRCSMGDACSNPPTSEGVVKVLKKNFERHYTTNRAPFGLFYHAAWFTQPHHKEGFIQFLDELIQMPDVYLVTNWQALQWIRDPTPLSRLGNFEPFKCDYSNRPKRCNNPKVCNLWHKSGVRYMRTCQPCPDIYPWTGKTGIRSSRIDNDIED